MRLSIRSLATFLKCALPKIDVSSHPRTAQHDAILRVRGRFDDQYLVARTSTPRFVSHSGRSAVSARSAGME
jgi:hypothetical protein